MLLIMWQKLLTSAIQPVWEQPKTHRAANRSVCRGHLHGMLLKSTVIITFFHFLKPNSQTSFLWAWSVYGYYFRMRTFRSPQEAYKESMTGCEHSRKMER